MELQPRQEHHEVKDTTPRISINTHTHESTTTRKKHKRDTYPSNRKKAFVGVGMRIAGGRRNGPGARRQTAAVPSGPNRRKGYPQKFGPHESSFGWKKQKTTMSQPPKLIGG